MAKRGKGGVVRSMSTSRFMDTEDGARVFGKEIYVTGSDQNDGVWAALAWQGGAIINPTTFPSLQTQKCINVKLK